MKIKSKNYRPVDFLRQILFPTFLAVIFIGCQIRPAAVEPAIEFTKIPPAGEGGPERVTAIEGRVRGGSPNQKIVLFAHSGSWWVQPRKSKTMTDIEPDGSWRNETHFGSEYAAILVEPDYIAPSKTDELPAVGGPVKAVSTVAGEQAAAAPEDSPKSLQFSGYEWKIRTVASDRSGGVSKFDPANAWIDDKGFLHLKISRQGPNWMCAEVSLTRSLGYGTYRFVTHDLGQLEPAAVLGFSTWDDLEAGQNHREVDIEMTRWGDPANKNLQYVVQPYNVPANVARFAVPAGVLTHTFDWQPGRIDFRTIRGEDHGQAFVPIAGHLFTAGVPAPGNERVLINFYTFRYSKIPLKKDSEVVIEKFEFLP